MVIKFCLFERAKIMWEKKKNAGNQGFLLFTYCFLQLSFSEPLKVRTTVLPFGKE